MDSWLTVVLGNILRSREARVGSLFKYLSCGLKLMVLCCRASSPVQHTVDEINPA